MTEILLINPNASAASTDMMVAIAQGAAPSGWRVTGATAAVGPGMIVNPVELGAAAQELQRTWRRVSYGDGVGAGWDGVIVSAFGDPGMDTLRQNTALPVAGICEASLLEAAAGGRRFGIATVTPDLAALIHQRVDELGLGALYTGIRLTPGAPRELAADPASLQRELALAVDDCIHLDGAKAVVIGGGPLAQAAGQLQALYGVPIIEPIPAAMRQLAAKLALRGRLAATGMA
ncbi:MAG: aspartate/glutamate racemase family protein [Comamonadaceae bacterium]|nr:MAG: aspartate/glutamate racemase family protein [Comamonadaceae bacterium]